MERIAMAQAESVLIFRKSRRRSLELMDSDFQIPSTSTLVDPILEQVI
jgi:hypothetical protein